MKSNLIKTHRERRPQRHTTKAKRGAGVPAWAAPHLPLNRGKNFLIFKN